ncbi:MAJOR FACILITATOR SUPERFAMILY PROTEIN [Salix purpurea]|uniref:MAJOR FACILITATOR SUPERFAMILY PROTEIN n=1 Tax=Salix purpurea TaxID=77065 RepID=A0A9Q0WFN1_SALPP|nr:MAJOR FACILITATOR SUPERFAMILY PROTEIN [Salix purpurea]
MEKLAGLSHLFVTVFLSSFASLMVIPAITDVTMSAVCPGKDECSLAIYLSGFQQAIIGLGTVVMMPLIGNLSDQYGRKALLTLPMTLSIIPLVILAYSRTTTFFYAYYLLRTLTAMICEGSINCLALAYVADNVLERQRTSAFGILSGIATAAFVCGTLAARFLSTASTFQVAALVSMLAAVYMRIFLRESLPNGENLTRPILKSGQDGHCQDDGDLSGLAPVLKKIPSIQDITGLLKSSVTFSQAAVVAFFNSIAEGGMQASIMYYLKARFHFSKNQYADLMLLLGIAGMASQLVFMPLLAQLVAEEKLLAIGLLGGIADALLFSVAWSNWVPYATTIFAVFMVFVPPCLRSIASKQVGPTEQVIMEKKITKCSPSRTAIHSHGF